MTAAASKVKKGMRPALRAFVAGGLGFAVSLIAACGGGSRVLSADQAGALNAQLSRLQSAVQGGDCGGVQNALQQLSVEIANVPNTSARNNLTEGYNTLQQQATANCPTSTPTKTTSTQTTTTHTVTQTVPTVTTHTQTTPTTAPATTPTVPGTTTSSGPGSGGAGLAPGSSGGAPGQTKQNGNGP